MQKVELAALLLTAMVGTKGVHAESLPLHVTITEQKNNQQKNHMLSKFSEVHTQVNLPRDGSLEEAKKAIAKQVNANADKLVLSSKGHPLDHSRWVAWIRKARQPGVQPSLDVAVRK